MTNGWRSPTGAPRAGADRDEDVVELTLEFETPVTKDDLRERCEEIADRLE